MKKLLWFLIGFMAIFFIGLTTVDATESHHHEPSIVYVDVPIEIPVETPVYIDVPRETIIRETINKTTGTALGIAASQCHHDFATVSLQGCAGIGSFMNEKAYSFGLAKRFDRVLINGSVSTENSNTAIGAGINFRF